MVRSIRFPELRDEVIAALRSLSDLDHQRNRWGRYVEGKHYYDDLTMNVNILYDDCMVLPNPETAVSELLYPVEVEALRDVHRALDPLISDLGERPDNDYLADPRWADVLRAAGAALALMEAMDSEEHTGE